MIPEQPLYYPNSNLCLIEHRIVDANSFQEFQENVLAFYGEDNTKIGDIIVSSGLFNKVVCGADFINEFDPVTRFENVMRGFIGTLLTHHIFTDVYLHPSDPDRIFADGGKRPQMILLQQMIAVEP